MQHRYRSGYDEALQARLISVRNEEEEKMLNRLAARYGKYGNRVEAAVSRRLEKSKEWRYEVKWKNLEDKQNTFESVAKLRQLGVERLASALDERLAAGQAEDQRPLTEREIAKHLEGFGLSRDLVVERDIRTFSGGQKSKLMIGAAFWTRPHVVCLDEPTNFMDFETVSALGKALKNFKGGVVVVSHNEDFLASFCNEIWSVEDREVTIVRPDDPLPPEEGEEEGTVRR